MASTEAPQQSQTKSHGEDQETESILEAIEVGNTHDEKSTEFHDIEKTPTPTSGTSHEPATTVNTALDWTGPDDPDNPHNWSAFKKAYHFWPVRGLMASAMLHLPCTDLL